MRRVLAFALAGALLVPKATLSAQAVLGDSLHRIDVVPSHPVRRGVVQEFVFTIQADLRSADSAAVVLMANTQRAKSYIVIAEKPVARGSSRVQLSARVAPMDWGEEGAFGFMVSFVPLHRSSEFKGWSSFIQPIVVTP